MAQSRDYQRGDLLYGAPHGGFLIDIKHAPNSRNPEVTLRKELPPQDVVAELDRLAEERAALARRLSELQAKIAEVKR